jgi:hypothetical protein
LQGTAQQLSVVAIGKQRILSTLTREEEEKWRAAVEQAEADGTFFIAVGHHCAVGTKP